jgi:cysteine-rich repeat protein
LTIADIYTTSL